MTETAQQIIDRIEQTPLTQQQIHDWSEAFRCRIAAGQTGEVATLLRAFAVQAVIGKINPAAPSGLQRATEQQAIALHAARCDWGWDGSPYKSAADCWAAAGHDEHREGFRRQASELIAILAIGPADQPEQDRQR